MFQNFHNAEILKNAIESYFCESGQGDLWVALKQKDNEKSVSLKLLKTISVRRGVLVIRQDFKEKKKLRISSGVSTNASSESGFCTLMDQLTNPPHSMKMSYKLKKNKDCEGDHRYESIL